MNKTIEISKFVKNSKNKISDTIPREYITATGKEISLLVKNRLLNLEELSGFEKYKNYFIRFTNDGITDCFFLMEKKRAKKSQLIITGQMAYNAKDIKALQHLKLSGNSYAGLLAYPCLVLTKMPYLYEQVNSMSKEEKDFYYHDLHELTTLIAIYFLYNHVQDSSFLCTTEKHDKKIILNKYTREGYSPVSINTCPNYLLHFLKDLHMDRNTLSLYELTHIPKLLNFFISIDEKEDGLDKITIFERTPEKDIDLIITTLFYRRDKVMEGNYENRGRIRKLPFVHVKTLAAYNEYDERPQNIFPYNEVFDFIINLFAFYLYLKNYKKKSIKVRKTEK